MNNHLAHPISRTWRCTSCGRFVQFAHVRTNPRECHSCGRAQLVPAAIHLSFLRLLDD
jgi:hypothetical protein